jgi:peptidoglycan/LPS O-acetylase OafA/YrhL
MIEISRYVLAAMVAQTHLWPQGAGWTGQICVFAFYTLSGYLMTRVLNERYGCAIRGTAAFALNRVLRLWPAYLATMTLVLVALQFWPLQNFFCLIRTPASAADIITNATVIGQVGFDFVQWLPLAKPLVTSWSLSIEICCYLLLAVYFARSPARLWGFAGVGVVAMVLSTGWCATSANPAAYGPYCFQNRYGVIQAGFVPFALGGLYYFYRGAIAAWLTQHRLALIIAFLGALVAMFGSEVFRTTLGPFIGIPVMWTLLSLSQARSPTNLADFFGRASYHLFIAHMPLAAVLFSGLHFPPSTLLIYVATVLAALGLSGLLVPMERRINDVRRQIASAALDRARVSKVASVQGHCGEGAKVHFVSRGRPQPRN